MAGFNIAGKIIDVYDDINKDILRDNLTKIGGLKLDPVDIIEKLSDDKFAAIFITKTGRAVRKLPIHTPDATMLSNLYFQKVASVLPSKITGKISYFIKEAYQRHGLETPSGVEKNANVSSSNVIDLRNENSEKYNVSYEHHALGSHYPIDNKEQVKCASSYFNENCIYFTPYERHKFAESVLKRCDEMSFYVDGSSAIHKYAGSDYGNIIDLAKHERENLLADDEMSIRALNHLFEKKSSLRPEEFAKQLESFDKATNLDRFWDKSLGVRDPYKSTYESIKMASVIKVGSKSISHERLHEIAQSGILNESFDDEFCRQFSDAPVEIFNSLPTPEQNVIIGISGDM